MECLCVLVLDTNTHELDGLKETEIEELTCTQLSKLLCVRGLPLTGKAEEMRDCLLKESVDRSVLH